MPAAAQASSPQTPGVRRVLGKIARELGLAEGSAELAEMGDRLAALWNTPINEDELVKALLVAWRERRQAP